MVLSNFWISIESFAGYIQRPLPLWFHCAMDSVHSSIATFCIFTQPSGFTKGRNPIQNRITSRLPPPVLGSQFTKQHNCNKKQLKLPSQSSQFKAGAMQFDDDLLLRESLLHAALIQTVTHVCLNI